MRSVAATSSARSALSAPAEKASKKTDSASQFPRADMRVLALALCALQASFLTARETSMACARPCAWRG